MNSAHRPPRPARSTYCGLRPGVLVEGRGLGLVGRGADCDATTRPCAGAPARVADVGVADGRIAAVGDVDSRGAGRVIDADGLVLSPGFIDLHTHSDFTLP